MLAHGAKISNKMVGNLGDIGCFSFYANKVLTSGEGGMICTNNKNYYKKINLLKTWVLPNLVSFIKS